MLKSLVKKIKSNNLNQLILKNTIGAFLVKGAALVISFLTIPAYMRYFSEQKVLGVWYTILSVLIWVLNFDLGIGNGLRNKLVEAIAKNNKHLMRGYISSAYFMVGVLTIIIALTGLILSHFIPWNSVFNISSDLISPKVMLRVVRSVFLGIMLQFFFRLINSILYALQYSAINNFISLISSIMQLIFVLLAPSRSPESNLVMLADFYIVSSNMPLLLATIFIFCTQIRSCFPRFRYVKRNYATAVFKLGGTFFWCQIMYMIIMNTNEFFISQFLNPSYVVEYQVYNRLFSLPGTLFALALTPVWSAVTKAMAEKDYTWLNSLYRFLKQVGWVAIGAEFLIIPYLQLIINLWLQDNAIQVNCFYGLAFAIFGGVLIYLGILSTIVCGIGKMRLQMLCYTFGVVIKFVFLFIGFKIYKGWILVIFSNIFVLAPYCVLQQISLDRYIAEKPTK
ncbi:MAG TPA: hypothetical protein GXX17_06825 [Clostridiales bacterium]|nr:hypothetical protein [Clostridiales bacterium]